ncbi:phenylalanine--tRNA ligase subunit beta [Candidatus Woesearchaeota archaeon]|nr:phenylalanine--tRNA ligase subunit beta [Candidatus Woesearchaeota archaeon]
MPTIEFSFRDFCTLLGKKISEKRFEDLLSYAKAELDDLSGDVAKVDLNDTNLPVLWSVEGLARRLKGIEGIETGLFKPKVKKTTDKVVVDKKLSKIRPFIACFRAKGKPLDEYMLLQLIQLQEKLCENFGRKRKKISIGVYPSQKITFPVHFKGVSAGTKFIPLECTKEMTITEILEKHSKGKEYAAILEGVSLYPVLMDSKQQVLSLAPIINSERTGKLEIGDSELFFDATGTDEESVMLAATIFAAALYDRGFEIEALTVEYADRKVVVPSFDLRSMKFDPALAESIIGIKLKESEIKKYLESMRYGYSKGVVQIPAYRNDIMHVLDIIEDLCIAYGYHNLKSEQLNFYSAGSVLPGTRFTDLDRSFWVGLGYQEIFSAILSNSELLYKRMCVEDLGTVEIDNYMSQSYSVVRSWILPILMDCLSKNKHVDYPQRVFESGLICQRHGDIIKEEEHVAAVSAHSAASFTEMRQHAEFVLRSHGIECSFKEFDLGCFIPGRAAKIIVKGKEIGFVGEIHPKVLDNFSLLVPVAACEINLNLIKE